jgi:hypothetical protein
MATSEQVQVVADMHRTFSARDVDGFVSNLTDDCLIRPSAFIAGRAEYRGRDDVRAGFGEIAALVDKMGEDVLLEPQSFHIDRADESKVMTLAQITIVRADGGSFEQEIAYLFGFEGDKVATIDAWLAHAEGLASLEEPEEVSPG